MESWRGLGRRVGREALGWLEAAWKTGGSPDGPTAGENGHNGTDGVGDAGMSRAESTEDGSVPGRDKAVEEERIARGTGVQEQIARGAEVRERNSVNAPERGRASMPEQNRVPGWLQTGAAWSWRLLLLALALYLIARAIGVLYIVVVPCTAALLLTALLQPLTARLRRTATIPPARWYAWSR
jgi:hypothetical protein